MTQCTRGIPGNKIFFCLSCTAPFRFGVGPAAPGRNGPEFPEACDVHPEVCPFKRLSSARRCAATRAASASTLSCENQAQLGGTRSGTDAAYTPRVTRWWVKPYTVENTGEVPSAGEPPSEGSLQSPVALLPVWRSNKTRPLLAIHAALSRTATIFRRGAF